MTFPKSRRYWVGLTAFAMLVISGFIVGCGPADRGMATISPEPVATTPERVSPQTDGPKEQTDLPPLPPKEPPQYPNLDSNLNRLAEQAQTQPAGQQPNTTGSISTGSALSGEPVLVTFHVEPEQVADVRQFLEDNDVFIRNVGEDYIEAHVPPALLSAASERPGVRRVDTVIPPQPAQGRVISQGVALHGASAWHSAGYRGQGVKIGIIDLGFDQFSQLQQGGELPPNVFARCYFEGSQHPSSNLSDCEVDDLHGTTVAETVIDVAPDAQLYIAQPISPGDLRNAVEWMASQDVQVINLSLGYPPDGPGDGTSPFSDSPLRTIDAAVSSGITWMTAGGNNARRTWYGAFRGSDRSATGVQLHLWSSTDVGNDFVLLEGQSVTAFMRWDDSWGTADCDLDLTLFRWFPTIREAVLIDADIRLQDGRQGSYPFALVKREEALSWQEGSYFLAISKDNPSSCPHDPAWIQLTAWVDDPELQYHSPSHHIGNPAESRNPGMIAVGATHWWDTQEVAEYSSRGPTIDGRVKPDITGITCNPTAANPPVTLPDGSTLYPTCGTSHAAPHIAGLAALVQQKFSDYTPVQLTDYLRRHSAERGAAGTDNTWGHGLATLPDPSASFAPTTVGMIADATLSVDEISTMDVSKYFIDDNGDMLTYTAGSSDAMIATTTVSGSMLTVEGKMEGTATITVTATDLAGSGMSATQTFDVTVTTELMAPSNVRVNPVGSGLVNVGWDPVPGAAGYTIIAVNIANPAEARTKSVNNPNATAGQIGNLTIGEQYNIYVGSFDANLDFAIDFSEKRRVTVE